MPEASVDMSHPMTAIAAGEPIAGAIIGLLGDVLVGWALEKAHPEKRLVVEIMIDGCVIAVARADQYQPEPNIGDQYNGFAVHIKQAWLNEASVITVRVANVGFSLNGEVKLPTAEPKEVSTVNAQVWYSGGLRINGWAWDAIAPLRQVEIGVFENGRLLTRVICNEHHQALAYRSSTMHGFTVDLPWALADGNVHVLEVLTESGKPLSGSPIRLCCRPEGLTGLLRTLPIAPDNRQLMLLTNIAKEHEGRMPKSAGWHNYPQWFDAFQHIEEPILGFTEGTVGILLMTEGDQRLETITLNSLDESAETKLVVKSSANHVDSALRQLLNAGCDRILPLTAGDRLAGNAVNILSALLEDNIAWAFADCDRDDNDGNRSNPWLKPIWDIDFFIGADIFTPGAIFRASVIEKSLIVLSKNTDRSSFDWHHVTAAVAFVTENEGLRVTHLPRVLYHRAFEALPSPEQGGKCLERENAITWLCHQLANGASLSRIDDYPALLRAHWPLPEKLPSVTLIIPTRDQHKLLHACIEGLLNNTDYEDLEIIVIDNQSSDPQTLSYLSSLTDRGVTVLPHPYPFNYSTINNRAAKLAKGELVGLINNDIEVIENGWLKEMVSHAMREGVGAVGAKLLWPNQMVQHGGVVVGINDLAAHSGNVCEDRDSGYLGRNQIALQQSAVTAACLLVRKSVYEEVNGLDEIAFPVAFNDVDFCLKLTTAGHRIVWTPFAKLIHAESASRGKDLNNEKQSRAKREQVGFINKWSLNSKVDAYYHPAMSHDYLSGPYGGLAIPPKNMDPRICREKKFKKAH